MFGFKPCAKTRIVNLPVALPEVGRQRAQDAKMTQLKLDVASVLDKPLRILYAYAQPYDFSTFALRFDHHNSPSRGLKGLIWELSA
jgi:hypothetical protein